MKIIAHLRTDFKEKFGIPRQSGLVQELTGRIVFEPEYRNPDAVRGIEEFSHLWVLWGFEGFNTEKNGWSPTVRPPRLGGNERVGVFATRSPNRPNPIGLSCVKLCSVIYDKKLGPVINISGIDMLDMTPVYDIKPYLAYVDSHPEATNGFADDTADYSIDVCIPTNICKKIPQEHIGALYGLLAQDPRPAYQNDPCRIYGLKYADMEIKFKASDGKLTVCDILPCPKE